MPLSHDDGSIELAPIVANPSKHIRGSFEEGGPGEEDFDPLLPDFIVPGDQSAPNGIERPQKTRHSSELFNIVLPRISRSPLSAVMEKAHTSKFRYYGRKLAVESEPGLTNTQLMLNES